MSLNSAALYGESIFTSFRSYDGHVPGLNKHLNRLYAGVNEYYFNNRLSFSEFSSYFELPKLKESIVSDQYYRLSIFSSQSEITKPLNLSISDLICDFQIKALGPAVDAPSIKLVESPFSSFKSKIKAGSYFENLYSKRRAQREGFDDVLFFNENTITELSTSNIILKRGSDFFSPQDKSIFQGITLELFDEFLKSQKRRIKYKQIKKSDLVEFSEVYSLNSVRGICAVERIDNLEYSINNNIEKEFIHFLGSI